MTPLDKRFPDLLDDQADPDMERLVVNLDWAFTSQRMPPARDALIAGALRERALTGAQTSGRPASLLHVPTHRSRASVKLSARVGAILAVAVLLMGAGVAGSYVFGGPFGWLSKLQAVGNHHLYTTIEQSQLDQGITVTVHQAYADRGSTLLYYSIQVSPELAQRYDEAMPESYNLTDQFGETPQIAGLTSSNRCTPMSNARVVDCLTDAAPFDVGKDVTQVTITFDVLTIQLHHGGQADFHGVAGHWDFQFTLPFHQNSLGPSELQLENTPPQCIRCWTPAPSTSGMVPTRG